MTSFAYIFTRANLKSLTRSFANNIYIKGPNFVPCGTTLITGKYGEWNEFKHHK